jgi:hypothetical protein
MKNYRLHLKLMSRKMSFLLRATNYKRKVFVHYPAYKSWSAWGAFMKRKKKQRKNKEQQNKIKQTKKHLDIRV